MAVGGNIAGIVPISCQRFDFNYPWHECLMPLASDFTLIERDVIECAAMGCCSIWLVCYNEFQPIIKKRVGDYVRDTWFEDRLR